MVSAQGQSHLCQCTEDQPLIDHITLHRHTHAYTHTQGHMLIRRHIDLDPRAVAHSDTPEAAAIHLSFHPHPAISHGFFRVMIGCPASPLHHSAVIIGTYWRSVTVGLHLTIRAVTPKTTFHLSHFIQEATAQGRPKWVISARHESSLLLHSEDCRLLCGQSSFIKKFQHTSCGERIWTWRHYDSNPCENTEFLRALRPLALRLD